MTEFEFFQEMQRRKPGQCIGPAIRMTLRKDAYLQIYEALMLVNRHDFLALRMMAFDEAGDPIFEICASHWIDISSIAEGLSAVKDHPEWERTAYLLFRQVCKALDWDYREMLNYIQSLQIGHQVNG